MGQWHAGEKILNSLVIQFPLFSIEYMFLCLTQFKMCKSAVLTLTFIIYISISALFYYFSYVVETHFDQITQYFV